MNAVQTTAVALGRILALSGGLDLGSLYTIDPSQPAGDATLVADIGNGAITMAFDGTRVFTTSGGGLAQDPYLSIVTPGPTLPWSVQHVRNPDHLLVGSLVFDGSSMWLASVTGELLRLDSNGAVTQVVPLGSTLAFNAVFDGANLWLSSDAGLQVVRASDGILVTTLADAGVPAGFDGSRVLVLEPQNALSVYRAADLTLQATFPTGDPSGPIRACSDGINFWVALFDSNKLGRF